MIPIMIRDAAIAILLFLNMEISSLIDKWLFFFPDPRQKISLKNDRDYIEDERPILSEAIL
jgi:hypothetical protein